MQFGKSLIGALAGSAIGVVLVAAVYYAFTVDQAALAILIAACTGMGVRAIVTTRGHASYLRGAMTCIVAIGAFAASKYLIVDMAARGLSVDQHPIKRVAVAPADDGAVEADDAAKEPQAAVPHLEQRPSNTDAAVSKAKAPQSFSTWDFLWLSVAALLAYELGRGTETAAKATPLDEAESGAKLPAE